MFWSHDNLSKELDKAEILIIDESNNTYLSLDYRNGMRQALIHLQDARLRDRTKTKSDWEDYGEWIGRAVLPKELTEVPRQEEA